MGILIGRVVADGKVHMHIDGLSCGSARKAKISKPIADDMPMWILPTDLCKRCFRAPRAERASRINSHGARWSYALDLFLSNIEFPSTTNTSPERLAQMIREIGARFRSEGIVTAA